MYAACGVYHAENI